MELADQVQLIREFMLRIAPGITKHNLTSIEDYAASDNAKMCLEWSMYLAGAFATFSDEALKAIKTQDAATASEQTATDPS
jgi:hypothetical protein